MDRVQRAATRVGEEPSDSRQSRFPLCIEVLYPERPLLGSDMQWNSSERERTLVSLCLLGFPILYLRE